jgi:tetratricopeptide (TPR) repeat protein
MTILHPEMPGSKKQRGKGKGRASGTIGPASPKPETGGKVIHVAFGPGGGRIQNAEPPKSKGETKFVLEESSPRRNEPVTDLFSPREVAKLLGMTPARLRSLDRANVVSPSAMRNGRRAYTFQDLIALRATSGLLQQRIRLKDVVQAIGALRRALPRVTRPLQELRIVSDGRKVVVQVEDGAFEPVSGQMVLDFRVDNLRKDVVRVLRPEPHGWRSRSAYDYYMRASALDEDPATFDEAESLYRKATELDPHLAIAYTNLGNIRFRRGDEAGAEQLYRKALEIDDRQPEAHYNLGYVMLERGQASRAIPYFEAAIKADPRFADAHFNLAMAYEALSDKARARVHWKRYLELEPAGTWADIARDHL